MKVYGIYDLVMEDYVMVTLANNDKSAIRGIRCPEGFNPSDFELRRICDLGDVDFKIVGKLSDFVDPADNSVVSSDSVRKISSNM